VDKRTELNIANALCRLSEGEDAPFSFKNRQQMTQNTTEFRVRASHFDTLLSDDLHSKL